MAQPQDAFNYWTRRWTVDGVPSSGENKPQKADAQVFGGILQGALTSLIEGLIIGGAVVYSTRALLFADLAHAANVLGVVYLDGTPANNGVYQKVGASGSGSWTLTNLALPSTFATDLATVIAGLAAHIGTGGAAHAVATASVAGFLAAADKAKLDGIATSADVTAAGNVGAAIHGTAAKATPVDADEVALIDSAAGNALKKLTWAALKTALGALYQAANATLTAWAGKAVPSGTVVGTTDIQTLTGKTITSPLGIVKGDVGLGNVDNTSDANKPISNAEITALAGKQAASTVLTFLATATSNTAAAVKTILALVKADVGLANVDNTADASKPVSSAQAAADTSVANTAASALSAHATNLANPHVVTKAQVGLGNADNTSDVNKPISSAESAALAGKQAASAVLTFLATAAAATPSGVKTLLALVKGDVGLANADNTSDANKPVSSAQAAADTSVANTAASALASHAGNLANPHVVTKAQVGLANADNTSDANKPISSAQSSALAAKAAASDVALLQTQQADFIGDARNHPGDVPTLLTSSMTGSAASRLPLAVGGPVVSDYFGAAWQVDAAAIASLPGSPGFVDVAMRMDLPMDAAGKYLVYWGFERAVNPVDPSGEGIELRIQSLTKAKAAISNVVFGDLGAGAFGAGGPAFNPTVATGPIERGLVISRAAGTDVDYQVPSTTRYVSISVRIYGATGKTNVGRISYDDVSLAKTIAGGAAAVQANLDIEVAARASGDSTLTTNKADKTITIAGGGLATGGGSLAANRTITVPAAVSTDLNDGITAAASAAVAITPAALATVYGQHADLVGVFAATLFSASAGVVVFSPQGHMRHIVDEWGEGALDYPWQTRFSGYQVFPDQNGRGLGVIDPVCGYIDGLKIYGVNHKAFGVGWGPTDENGNYAFYVDPVTGALNTRATSSSYKIFEVDHTDHGRNIGLLANNGRQAILTYDEGYCTPNNLSDVSLRVTRLSSYKIGLVGDSSIIPAGTASYHDLSLIPAVFTLDAGRTKLRYYPGRGQSDWNGTHSNPALTTVANNPGVAKMFIGGPLSLASGVAGWTSPPTESIFNSIVDLHEGAGGVETPMSGLASQIVGGFASDAAGLFCTFAIGGSDYDQLARGTWCFETMRLGYIYHLLHCFLNSFTPVLGGVTIGWASSDALEGMSQANYRTRMITEQTWHQRCKAELYNDPTDCIVYFIIETAWPDWSLNTGPFRAQWQLHNQFPTKFRVVASDQNRDEVSRASGFETHYDNHGDLHIGEMAGYGVKRVETAQTYPCVAVIGATPNFASSYVDVLISLMSGSLVSDTSGTLEVDPGNLGMYWTQTGGMTRTLVSAAIQNANNGDGTATVRLTLSGNPGAPSYWEVGAIFGQLTNDRPNGPRSPLRDGSSFTSLDGATVHPGWIVPSYYPSTGW